MLGERSSSPCPGRERDERACDLADREALRRCVENWSRRSSGGEEVADWLERDAVRACAKPPPRRSLEVLRLIAQGLSGREIGERSSSPSLPSKGTTGTSFANSRF